MTNGLSGPRKQFLDVLRVLATCAVVLMHVLTGATDVTDASIVPEYRSLLLSVMDLVTWCVPMFLLISGYRRRIRNGSLCCQRRIRVHLSLIG